MPEKVKVLVGDKYNSLTVINELQQKTKGIRRFLCKCDCNNLVEVTINNLRSGSQKQCKQCGYKKTAESRTKHGQCTRSNGKTSLYNTWKSIKQRCLDSNCKAYPRYGGRGITMQENWINDFQAFADYVGVRPTNKHSIDRIDNNSGYVEGNIRWATRKEQSDNTRRNVLITKDGETHNVTDWCRIIGINYSTVRRRIKKGVSPLKAITQPANKGVKVEEWK